MQTIYTCKQKEEKIVWPGIRGILIFNVKSMFKTELKFVFIFTFVNFSQQVFVYFVLLLLIVFLFFNVF
jgi:hypothetical protein